MPCAEMRQCINASLQRIRVTVSSLQTIRRAIREMAEVTERLLHISSKFRPSQYSCVCLSMRRNRTKNSSDNDLTLIRVKLLKLLCKKL